jgi:hypothetical protein
MKQTISVTNITSSDVFPRKFETGFACLSLLIREYGAGPTAAL